MAVDPVVQGQLASLFHDSAGDRARQIGWSDRHSGIAAFASSTRRVGCRATTVVRNAWLARLTQVLQVGYAHTRSVPPRRSGKLDYTSKTIPGLACAWTCCGGRRHATRIVSVRNRVRCHRHRATCGFNSRFDPPSEPRTPSAAAAARRDLTSRACGHSESLHVVFDLYFENSRSIPSGILLGWPSSGSSCRAALRAAGAGSQRDSTLRPFVEFIVFMSRR